MLRLNNISLIQFKNYLSRSISFTERIVCISGRNGIGKTNLLDAIHYLCFTKSYFTRDANNILKGYDGFRLEGEFGNASSREWLDELHIDPNQVAGTAFDDGHPSFADILVADPRVFCALAGRSTFIGLLHGWIDFPPGVPSVPLAKIVNVLEDRRRGRGYFRAPRDSERGGLQRHDNQKENHDGGEDRQNDEDSLEHGKLSDVPEKWNEVPGECLG